MEASSFYGKPSVREPSEDEIISNDSSDDDYVAESSSEVSDCEDSDSSIEENVENIPPLDTNRDSSEQWEPVTVTQRKFAFAGKEGLLVDLPRNEDGKIFPIDIYKLFITNELLEMISDATNLYAEQVRETHAVTRRSRLVSWQDTTPDEIMKFFAIIIYMGLVHKPEISLYWSKSMIYDDSFVTKVMTRERFELLWGFIHFSDNADTANRRNRLHKIQPLVDKLLTQFQGVYEPGEDLILDESMIPFRGRLIFRQYLPGKAHKYGMKLYKLCTPEAYTWNIIVHSGATPQKHGLSSTESLSVGICGDLLNKGRTLFADNYYSSVPLAEYLMTKKTYYCGTVRANRKHLAAEVKSAKLKKGGIKSAENLKGVKFYNWRDKRNVLTISTVPEHGAGLISNGKKNRNGDDVFKPPSVLAYNKAKKGVDMSDQLSSYYSVLRKSKKWYRKIAFELLGGTSVVNAHILYQKYCDSKMNLRKFTESLILSVITGNPTEDIRCGKRKLSLNITNPQTHVITEADGPKRKSRKRCKGCYEKISLIEGFKVAVNKARRISTYCNVCPDQPYLCLPCFAEKHS